jgi:WD40 repeat protein
LIGGDKSEPLFRGPIAHTLRYDPSGRKLAVSSLLVPEVHIRDASSGAWLHAFKHATPFRGLAWRGDGKLLAAAGKDSQVYLWNVTAKPKIHAVLKGHDHEITRVAFNRRGNLLASSSWDSTMRLWDPLTGKLHLTAPLLGPLQFRQDDARLGFFEVANGIGLRRLDLGAKVISFEVSFSPDGGTLVNSMPDGARSGTWQDRPSRAASTCRARSGRRCSGRMARAPSPAATPACNAGRCCATTRERFG